MEKCEFHRSSMPFLGYIINASGIQMDQGKVDAVQNWSTPTSVKELQRFANLPPLHLRLQHLISSSLLTVTQEAQVSVLDSSCHGGVPSTQAGPSTGPTLFYPNPNLSLLKSMLPPLCVCCHSGRGTHLNSIHVPFSPKSYPRGAEL